MVNYLFHITFIGIYYVFEIVVKGKKYWMYSHLENLSPYLKLKNTFVHENNTHFFFLTHFCSWKYK